MDYEVFVDLPKSDLYVNDVFGHETSNCGGTHMFNDTFVGEIKISQ